VEQGSPRDGSGQDQAGFRLPLPEDVFINYPEDDAAVIDAGEDNAVGLGDIPRDNSGEGRAGFRLPLPEDTVEDLAVVVEAALDETQGRIGKDIPLDNSGPSRAGFRLPVPDFIIVETDFQSNGGVASDIPRDESGEGRAGFRLPLPENEDHAVVVEVGDVPQAGFRLSRPQIRNEDDIIVIEANINGDIAEKALSDIPRDHSGAGRAGFRLPLPEDDVIVVEAGSEELVRSLVTRDRSVCGKPVEMGRCRASLLFWTFNAATKQCEDFIFGGCGATEQDNLFSTLDECLAVCASP